MRQFALKVLTFYFITAHVQRTRKGTVFTGVCLLTFRGGVTPSQVWMVGGTPGLDGGGYPRSGLWGGTLGTPPFRQNSIVSTCYPAGGMPLAFTQEDFLVFHSEITSCYYCLQLVHIASSQTTIAILTGSCLMDFEKKGLIIRRRKHFVRSNVCT